MSATEWEQWEPEGEPEEGLDLAPHHHPPTSHGIFNHPLKPSGPWFHILK